MLTVTQTDFNGIDSLTYHEQPTPKLPANGVQLAMTTWPVVPSDWHRESQPDATAEQLATLPRIIGIGGVGEITAVGAQRDARLCHQRALVMHPSGSYAETIISTNPDWLFPLPATVSDADAAALTAGPGTATVLRAAILANPTDNVVITGANAVIGLFLQQLLPTCDRHIYPIVSPASRAYFQQVQPHTPVYTLAGLPHLTGTTLIIDIAGASGLLQELISHCQPEKIVSIALQNFPTTVPFEFVHEDFDPVQMRTFIQSVATGRLKVPLDRTFPFTAVKAAQHYAQNHHSRGRVLVTKTKGSY